MKALPIMIVLSLCFSICALSQTNYYVNGGTGNDTNDGLAATAGGGHGPWLTIAHAASTVTAGSTGAIVHVADGTYKINGAGSGNAGKIQSSNAGTASNRIVFVSDNKWGAKILDTNNTFSPAAIAWTVDGDYTDVKDFDISGGTYTGLFVDGNHVRLIGNHLHHIGSAACTDGSAIYVNSPYAYVESTGNVIHDVGQTPWPTDCNTFHGIYYGGVTGGPVTYGTIANNIIYRVSGYGIHLWHLTSHINIVNNLVFNNVHGGIIIGASDGGVTDYINVNNNMVIYNSSCCAAGPSSFGWGIQQYINGGTIGTHNSYLNNLVWQNHATNWGGDWAYQAAAGFPTGAITGTVTADPLLVNYNGNPAVPAGSNSAPVVNFSNADYHLTKGSPAKDAGNMAVTVATDLDGVSRPQGSSYNIGPYESVSAPNRPSPPTGVNAVVH